MYYRVELTRFDDGKVWLPNYGFTTVEAAEEEACLWDKCFGTDENTFRKSPRVWMAKVFSCPHLPPECRVSTTRRELVSNVHRDRIARAGLWASQKSQAPTVSTKDKVKEYLTRAQK